MDALDAHTAMSKQALNSVTVREGMKDILLNYAGLWEALRARATSSEQALAPVELAELLAEFVGGVKQS